MNPHVLDVQLKTGLPRVRVLIELEQDVEVILFAGLDMQDVLGPAPGNRRHETALLLAHREPQVVIADLARESHDLQAQRGKQRPGIVGTERLEPAQGLEQFRIHFLQRREGVRLEPACEQFRSQYLPGIVVDAPVKGLKPAAVNRKPGRVLVAAETEELTLTGFERVVQVKTRDAAARAFAFVLVQGDENRRAVEPVGDARCDDADDPLVPVFVGQDQNVALLELALLNLPERRLDRAFLDPATLVVG